MNVVRNGFAVLTKDPQDFEQIAKFRALREASLKSLMPCPMSPECYSVAVGTKMAGPIPQTNGSALFGEIKRLCTISPKCFRFNRARRNESLNDDPSCIPSFDRRKRQPFLHIQTPTHDGSVGFFETEIA